ncbi:hypothetical protein GQR58_020938 [Nymphon striatum]|nr:hypothetical protein GQR58_020938 [Nymphon striatum]
MTQPKITETGEAACSVSSMTIADVSPSVAIRRVLLLYENSQFREAANFINRLNQSTFKGILGELPIDLFTESMPHSLAILEALYAKVFLSDGLNFSIKLLRPEAVVMQMVKLFAQYDDDRSNPKNSSMCPSGVKHKLYNDSPLIASCRKVLKVIVLSEPRIKKLIHQRRRHLDKAIKGLGQHGMVGTTDDTLLDLHEAIKKEFDRVQHKYKNALQKLEDLSAATKTPLTRSVSHGPAPTKASHQRQLSLRQREIQERVIRNKTLLNVIEPALTQHSLDVFMGILQSRVDFDKDVLLEFSQIKKEAVDVDTNSIVAPILMRFSHGCQRVLELMKEVSEDDEEDSSDISGYHSDSDSAAMLSISNSPYSSSRRKYGSIFGSVRKFSPRLDRSTGSSSDNQSQDEKSSQRTITNSRHKHTSKRHEIIKKLNSGSTTSSSSCGYKTDSNKADENEESKKVIDELRTELSKNKQTLVAMQEKEKKLKTSFALKMLCLANAMPCKCYALQMLCLANVMPCKCYALQMLCLANVMPCKWLTEQAEKLLERGAGFQRSTEERRPTTLIRKYGNLYAQARVDTLDSLDSINDLVGADELKSKLLFSVVVLSFRSVQNTISEIKKKVRDILQVPETQPEGDAVVKELEHNLSQYLRLRSDRFNLKKNTDEVCNQIWATLFDYPCLKSCEGLLHYVKNCVHLAWNLSNQMPAFVIEYETRTFRRDMHVRFHSSNQDSEQIRTYLWPALLEGENGPCVHKGVVYT